LEKVACGALVHLEQGGQQLRYAGKSATLPAASQWLFGRSKSDGVLQ
jgi:hypothetical protein